MTSTAAASALLRDLTFDAGGAGFAAPVFLFETDFDSSTGFPDLPYDASSAAARYAAEARAGVRNVLAASADAMAARVSGALAFVNAHLQRVLLRRTDASNGATSSSNRSHVGSCVLTNIHLADDRVLVCTEALVHEAVHQYLYRVEIADGAFCDLDAPGRFRSPWSGNRIPLHSLVHACFVYFALLNVWCRYARTTGDAVASPVRDRIARILFGYAYLPAIIAAPTFPAAGVQPAVLASIRRIADVAQAAALPVDARPNLAAALLDCGGTAWLERLAVEVEALLEPA